MSEKETVKSIEQIKLFTSEAIKDIEMLIKSTDVKRNQIVEKVDASLKKLDKSINTLEAENVFLQRLPKKLSEELRDKVPDIAFEISKLNQKHLEDALQIYRSQHQELLEVQKRNIVKYNSLVKDVAIEINKVKNDIVIVDKKRMRRYLLSMLGIGIFSMLLSLGTTRFMMSYFPTAIMVDSTDKIHAEQSSISIFGVKEVSIPKDNKVHVHK